MAARLLFLHHTSLKEAYGGVEYYMDDLVHYAQDLLGSHAVHCVYPKFQGEKFPNTATETWVPLSASPLVRKFQRRLSWKWLTAASAAVEAFQPTFLISSHVRMASFVYFLHRKHRLPYATVAYGIDVWGEQNTWEDFVLRRSSHIFSISDWTKRVLQERGHSASQISVVHPGFPREWENLRPAPARQDNRLKLLTISRLSALEQYKGQDHLLRALEILRTRHPSIQVEYTIQGEGTDKPRLVELVRTLQLSDRVRFADPVKSRGELSTRYSDADVLAMPSRYGKWDGSWRGEGFGIVYVEAAAHGVPSLAYDVGGATDIIVNEKTGWLLPADNIEKLAEKIADLAKNKEQVREAGERARAHILEKFSHAAILGELHHALGNAGVSGEKKSLLAQRDPSGLRPSG